MSAGRVAGERKGLTMSEVAERHAKILDAVGEVVAERGVHGLTTALVARRARVAPGKFYELFSDKYAVIAATADRNLDRFFRRIAAELDRRGVADVTEAVLTAYDVWVDMSRDDISFRVLRFGDAASVQAASDVDEDARLVTAFVDFLCDRFELDRTFELQVRLTMAIKLVDELILYAFEVSPGGDPDILSRTRRILEYHLSS
jgi:AcrR family transcriptional regulator